MNAAEPSTAPQFGEIFTFPDTAERQLRRALQKLDAALAEQRAAIAAFRAEIGALDQAVAGLGRSALGLRDGLAEAATETEKARRAAWKLEATAKKMEALRAR